MNKRTNSSDPAQGGVAWIEAGRRIDRRTRCRRRAARIAVIALLALAACEGGAPPFDPETGKSFDPEYGVERAGSSIDLELPVGEVVELSTDSDRAFLNGQSWPALQTGGVHQVNVLVGASETLDVRAFVVTGDVDVEVWRGPVLLDASIRSSNRTDAVTITPGSSGALTVKYRCYSGPCGFSSTLSVGDSTTFRQGALAYVNQRSWLGSGLSATVNCTASGGAQLADGECMCAPSSAAMALSDAGIVRPTVARATAENLFRDTNLQNGAANRVALMNAIETQAAYNAWPSGNPSCSEEPATSYKSHILAGSLVLLRSSAFSGAGHYIRVRGYSPFGIIVDDPYGLWASMNNWSPANTTSQTSVNGRQRIYPTNLITNPGTTLIVCEP